MGLFILGQLFGDGGLGFCEFHNCCGVFLLETGRRDQHGNYVYEPNPTPEEFAQAYDDVWWDIGQVRMLFVLKEQKNIEEFLTEKGWSATATNSLGSVWTMCDNSYVPEEDYDEDYDDF